MIYVEPDLWKDIKLAALEQDKSASQYLTDCHREKEESDDMSYE